MLLPIQHFFPENSWANEHFFQMKICNDNITSSTILQHHHTIDDIPSHPVPSHHIPSNIIAYYPIPSHHIPPYHAQHIQSHHLPSPHPPHPPHARGVSAECPARGVSAVAPTRPQRGGDGDAEDGGGGETETVHTLGGQRTGR